jgi:NAD(P)-dependent dehydrogenase (short-subunit alcohol dehydrogenase family)
MTQPTAVVIGVGPGLGWSLARRFVRAGMRAVIAARNRDPLETLIAKLDDGAEHERLNPADFEPHACDAADPADVAALFERVAATPAEIVVFNAGAFVPAGILDITPDTFERCWRVGCFGGFLVGQAAARLMVARGRGTIIFTGATASLRGGARFANLAVPKFGLRALAQSMARELGPQNVHVAHVIIDGQIESERYRHLADERGPDSLLSPDAIAEAYYQLHLQHRSAWTHELDLRPWSEKF